MKFVLFAIMALLATCMTSACATDQNYRPIASAHHPEARPFDEDPSLVAQNIVDQTLENAAVSGKHAMIVMGANWCHDSRALAGWFETPRFAALLNEEYSVAYIDVGQKDRNIDVAQRFGVENIVGTPTVIVTNAQGDVLNLDTAPTWRNAASRSEDEIFEYFEGVSRK